MTDQNSTPDPAADLPEDLFEVREVIDERLRVRVGQLVQARSQEIAEYAAELSVDVAMAAASGDQRGMRHLRAQAKNLAEKHRLGASKDVWQIISDLTVDLATVLAKALVV